MQARGQLAQVEGFEQIVVGTGLQAIDTVSNRVASGENQHRNLQALLAQLLKQFQAVFIGQPQVEHHHLELGDLEHRPGSRRRGHMFHGHALGRKAGNNTAGDQLIVFTDKYVHGETCRKVLIKKAPD
ncbi:hypothetical protein D3C80_1469510 [compost metagenome]